VFVFDRDKLAQNFPLTPFRWQKSGADKSRGAPTHHFCGFATCRHVGGGSTPSPARSAEAQLVAVNLTT